MFYVYKIVNKINGKIYIGKTSNVEDRWLVHIGQAQGKCLYPLQKAIKKYGADNFEISVLESLVLEDEALEREKFWIAEYKTNICRYGNEFGYNLTDGGDGISGYVHTKETKAKISSSLMGIKRPRTVEHAQKISKALKGHKISEDTRKKLFARPKRVLTEETKNKIGSSNKKFSEEQEIKILELRESGIKVIDLAKEYKCDIKTIYNIINRQKIK